MSCSFIFNSKRSQINYKKERVRVRKDNVRSNRIPEEDNENNRATEWTYNLWGAHTHRNVCISTILRPYLIYYHFLFVSIYRLLPKHFAPHFYFFTFPFSHVSCWVLLIVLGLDNTHTKKTFLVLNLLAIILWCDSHHSQWNEKCTGASCYEY